MRTLIRFICLSLLIPQLGLTAELNVKHGLWTANVEVTGLPIALPPHSFNYCVDKNSAIPQEKQMQGCNMQMQHEGNTVHWTMHCDNGGKGVGTATYQWDNMQAQVELTLPDGKLSLTSNMTGKWSGDTCPAAK
ncbi:MAG: DUF3617 family protein [Gammaproteobacteria bacterium]|nr:DUF3617 family protein [Gammaproteobacteria bacterium]